MLAVVLRRAVCCRIWKDKGMEVFPVGVALKGETVWLGWVSPDGVDEFFLTKNGYLIFSYDGRDGLVQEVLGVFPGAQIGVESFFDFDSAAGGLEKEVAFKFDFALDIWNLLTDIYHTFGGVDKMFLESHWEVYLRLFSQSEVAPLVDVQKDHLSAHDLAVVRKVILEGVEFLDQKVGVAKAARNH